MFDAYISVIQSTSRTLKGQTVGEIMKEAIGLTRGQVDRALRQLEEQGYVWSEVLPYGRTGKRVWRITENCAMLMAGVARRYTESCNEVG